jgi:hypothetical protein
VHRGVLFLVRQKAMAAAELLQQVARVGALAECATEAADAAATIFGGGAAAPPPPWTRLLRAAAEAVLSNAQAAVWWWVLLKFCGFKESASLQTQKHPDRNG